MYVGSADVYVLLRVWIYQLPDDGSDDERNEDDEEEEEEEEEEVEGETDRGERVNDEEEIESKGEHVVVEDGFDDDNVSERSSTLAEDDGTLYGKEFSIDNEDLKEDDCPPPVFNNAAQLANYKLVADSMNQKFIPEELRNEPSSIFDTAHIDVIKRSKLNLSEAENRIRHREPHLVFELLSKASEIYRNGVISSHELDQIRSMIVTKIQPTKMVRHWMMRMSLLIC